MRPTLQNLLKYRINKYFYISFYPALTKAHASSAILLRREPIDIYCISPAITVITFALINWLTKIMCVQNVIYLAKPVSTLLQNAPPVTMDYTSGKMSVTKIALAYTPISLRAKIYVHNAKIHV